MSIRQKVEDTATNTAILAVKAYFPTLVALQNAASSGGPTLGTVKSVTQGQSMVKTSASATVSVMNIGTRATSPGQAQLIVQLPGNINIGIA